MADHPSHEAPTSVTHALKGIEFPANREALLRHAKHNKADQAVLATIEAMPEQDYATIADVMKGFGNSH